MLIGVTIFSYANGTLASLMTTQDEKMADFNNRMNQLTQVCEEFKIPYELFKQSKSYLQYEVQQKHIKFNFMNSLPQNLKIDLSMYTNFSKFRVINFVKDGSRRFLYWICPKLEIRLF